MAVGVALLIGNAMYLGPSFPRLRTPPSDVVNLDMRLRELGFETLVCENATATEMATAFGQFSTMLERLPPGANAFFYFAGHGLQHGGENYLVPIDAVGSGKAILWSCKRLSDLLDGLCWRDDQQKWFAIDACRTNDLPSDTRNGIVGLAGESVRRYDRVKQTTVLHAAAPGHAANDGGAHGSSPFCRGILDALADPHRSPRELSLHVADYVSRATQEMQTPWETSCVTRLAPFVSPVGKDPIESRLPMALPPVSFSPGNDADRYVSERGHLIHKLKAKDTSGRWAYYFVLVEPEREPAFMAAIGGGGILDIEDFGRVVASSYGEAPTEEVRQHLRERYGFNV